MRSKLTPLKNIVTASLLGGSVSVFSGFVFAADQPNTTTSRSVAPSTHHASPNMLTYPQSPRTDTVDQYHGQSVADPFRSLEDTESDSTADWIRAQNELTRTYLDAIPQRADLAKRLTELWNFERYGLPVRRGDTYFFTHNDGLQNQSVLYTADGLDAPRKVLIDPNQLSEDGTIAMSSWEPTRDGKLVAYSLADGGSDWRTWKVRDVESGADLEDEVRWVKFSEISWLHDGSGFFYGRYAEPQPGEELSGTNYFQKLYFHRLGQPQESDTLIYQRNDEKEWGFSPRVTDDGRHLVITNWRSTEPVSQIFIKPLDDMAAAVQPLITGFDADYEYVASNGGEMFFITDSEAPRRRLIAVDINQPAQRREVIAATQDVLQSASLLGDRWFTVYLKDARGLVKVQRLDGSVVRELELPGLGSVAGFDGLRDAEETFYSFTNYVTPPSIYRLDLSDDATDVWRSPKVAIDVDQFVTEQVFYTSRDGTKVPMMITRHRDARRDGTHRTLLYGYGGFNISLTPTYSPAIAAWLDSGGIYAVPSLRGGGEYGRDWHEAGMIENKQNVFDDFIAAAEELIRLRYTTAKRLGIRGGSNGGLLVGAVMTQRPDLFGACLPAVGVMDMLRFHRFTIGWAWVSEFGSSDDPEQFKTLLSYSPLHNLLAGTCYPATLITTADRDDRVVPGHSFKFAAALQAAQSCPQPVLIRIETRAGHGAGTPVSKSIDEYADLWAFLIANLK
ncbi:MAG: prolyl oligopeptidase family serine peptidase [Planctomycetaceae bacterium]